jgi:hypothetical protein
MSAHHDESRGFWKPDPRKLDPRVRALAGRAIDLIFPPHALDQAARPQSPGMSADAWSRVRFIAEPLCDGCGQPIIMITKRNKLR